MDQETEITQDQVYETLKRLLSDKKLHEMPEDELLLLIHSTILRLGSNFCLERLRTFMTVRKKCRSK